MNADNNDVTATYVPSALGLYAIPKFGEVPGFRVLELFAYAASEGVTGSLTIEPTHGAKVIFRLQGGAVARWQSLDDHQFVLESLAESLPPEQLEFVRRHAFESNLDEFEAAARLGLLSYEALEWIHRGATVRLLRVLSEPRRRYRYSFDAVDSFQGQDGFSRAISAPWLLTECLLASENLAWCRERLQAIADVPIRLTSVGIGVLPTLLGKARGVVLELRKGPESLDRLRKSSNLGESALVGTLYALLATGAAELVLESTAVPRPTESVMPARDEPPKSSVPARFRVRGPNEWINAGYYRSHAQSPSDAADGRSVPSTGSHEAAGLAKPRREASTEPPSSTDRPTPANLLRSGASTGPRSRPSPRSERADRPRESTGVRPQSARPQPPPPGSTRSESLRSDSSRPGAPRGEAPGASLPPSRRAQPALDPAAATRSAQQAAETAAIEAWSRAIGADSAALLRAEKHLERLANHFPDNANILFYLGALYHLTHKTFEAETTLLRVVDLDPEHSSARDELVRVRRTIEGERRGPGGILRRLVRKG